MTRCAFSSQNVQNTPASEHFMKLGCGTMARRCGAKHMFTSKCTKHTSVGPLVEVGIGKNGTPFWREANFQVKKYKTHQLQWTLWSWDAEKWHAAVARSTFASQNAQNTPASDHFWKFACGNWYAAVARSTVRILKNYTPLWREAHFH